MQQAPPTEQPANHCSLRRPAPGKPPRGAPLEGTRGEDRPRLPATAAELSAPNLLLQAGVPSLKRSTESAGGGSCAPQQAQRLSCTSLDPFVYSAPFLTGKASVRGGELGQNMLRI